MSKDAAPTFPLLFFFLGGEAVKQLGNNLHRKVLSSSSSYFWITNIYFSWVVVPSKGILQIRNSNINYAPNYVLRLFGTGFRHVPQQFTLSRQVTRQKLFEYPVGWWYFGMHWKKGKRCYKCGICVYRFFSSPTKTGNILIVFIFSLGEMTLLDLWRKR